MKQNSRIRFNPVTQEVEIEGSESFVKTYFSKLQAMFSGVPVKRAAKQKGPLAGKGAPQRKTEKRINVAKGRPAKTKRAAAKAQGGPGKKVKKATNIDKVIALIQAKAEGISTAELKEKTGLAESQIWNIVSRATKEGKIKKVKMGLYGAV
ncbi:MAG: winged helix-turn-helix domain-containing protein [Deltaproteobacteria bacterium]|nr:winged helix-turn-helix domain-containing protein [Deltaproteobacteria bacterium]